MSNQTVQNIHQPASNKAYINGIETEKLLETVYAIQQQPELGACKFRANNKWLGGNQNCSTITGFYGAKQEIAHQQTFELYADEPPILAGNDKAANPVEHLLNSLAACLTTSMVAHAAVRGIPIFELESTVEGDLDLRGFLGLAQDIPRGFTDIRINFKVKSDEKNTQRLKELAEFSPVFNTLTNGVGVEIDIQQK